MSARPEYRKGQRARREGKPITHDDNKHWVKGWKDEDEVIKTLSPPEGPEAWAAFLNLVEEA